MEPHDSLHGILKTSYLMDDLKTFQFSYNLIQVPKNHEKNHFLGSQTHHSIDANATQQRHFGRDGMRFCDRLVPAQFRLDDDGILRRGVFPSRGRRRDDLFDQLMYA